MSRIILSVAATALLSLPALAQDSDPCTRFTWDVTHELSVMRQEPEKIAAGTRSTGEVPTLQLDKVYEVQLTNQEAVSFAVTPGKPTLPDNARGGLARFATDKPGRYRISITSGHWIDVTDGKDLIRSRDFQGARGCERPRKIVEYELPAGRELTLQLSGAPDAAVILAVTAVRDARRS